MHWGWKWTGVFLLIGLLDYGVRLLTHFDMSIVVPAEAVLFLGSSLLLWRLQRRSPAPVHWQHLVQLILVASFALGGLRSALWALGLAVSTANLIVLVMGVILIVLAWRRRRHGAAAP